MKVSLLLTGNELMSGDTVDSNSAYIAQSLKDLNLVPYIKKVVGDDLDLLADSIQELASVSDVLVINGGLGPTVDDLTALALSNALASPLVRNPDAYAKLDEWAKQRGFVITESNLKQAFIPEVCRIIDNPKGSAVGFRCVHNDCLIMCTPGVPSELKPMVEDHLLPLIRQHGAIETKSHITRLRIFGITESGLQDTVNEVFPEWPAEVELGFRVQMPVIEVKFTTIGETLIELNLAWAEKFRAYFSDYVIGRDGLRLTQALNNALAEKQLVLSTAESCTGQSLQAHGAVSEAVVREMAAGALQHSGADIALAISGIAGPEGGTPEKPVGTVWMAWGKAGQLQARRFFFPLARLAFQRTATAIAMDLVRREVLGLTTKTDYFSELKKKRSA